MRLRPILLGSINMVTGGTFNVPGPAMLSRLRLSCNATAQAGQSIDWDALGPVTIEHNGTNAHGQICSIGTLRGSWVYQACDEGINDRTSTVGGLNAAVWDYLFGAVGDRRNGFPLGSNEFLTVTFPAIGAVTLVSGTCEIYGVLAHCGCEYVVRTQTGTIPTLPTGNNTLTVSLPDNLFALILGPATGGGAANPDVIQIVNGDALVLARGTFDGLRRSGIKQYDLEGTVTDCMVPINYHDGAWAESLMKGVVMQVTGGTGALVYTTVCLESNPGLTDRAIQMGQIERERITREIEQSSLPAVVKQSITPGYAARARAKAASENAARRAVRRTGVPASSLRTI